MRYIKLSLSIELSEVGRYPLTTLSSVDCTVDARYSEHSTISTAYSSVIRNRAAGVVRITLVYIYILMTESAMFRGVRSCASPPIMMAVTSPA